MEVYIFMTIITFIAILSSIVLAAIVNRERITNFEDLITIIEVGLLISILGGIFWFIIIGIALIEILYYFVTGKRLWQ